MKSLQYSEIRLIKYTNLIDKAIAEQRYGLATQIAYRCCLEYHRLFIRFCIPNRKSLRQNAFQLSIVTVKYLRSHGRFISVATSKQLYKLLSTSYYLTNLSRLKWTERDIRIDKATAKFARDQSLAIAQFLIVRVNENVRTRN